MATVLQDARLRELAFLAKLEREGGVKAEHDSLSNPVFKSMVVHLLREGWVNGLESIPVNVGEPTHLVTEFGMKSRLQVKWETELWADIGRLLSKQDVMLYISHKGRVRRSELEQALRTGRDREPFGVLWAELDPGPDYDVADPAHYD